MTFPSSTWSSTPTERAAPGTTIGSRYTLRSAIGTGGMGTVWRAADTLLRRDVAVKEVVCPPGLAVSDREAMYERTLREARAAAGLSHPSVVQVYDVVTEFGRPWIVMELLDARSLADVVIEDGPLAPRAVAKIGIALLGALEVAHAAGVLHRDVKPANVLICADGRCVLTDFGVARMPTDVQLTTPGMVLGSPHFISPERAMGRAFGPPSDLFSLGVSLFTAVEGRPPFDRGDPIETMHAVVEDPPAPAVRAGPLIGVLMGLLEKDPARRWDIPSARGVLRDLLAGPLTSKTHDHVTDPYAVVPTQRGPANPAVIQSGQIGGRAMVAPGESIADAIQRSRGAAATAVGTPGTPVGTPAAPATTPGARVAVPTGHGWDERTGEWTAPTGQLPAPGLPRQYGRPAAVPLGRRSAGPLGGVLGPLAAIRRWPPRLQATVAGVVVTVLLVAVAGLARGWFGDQTNAAGAQPAGSSAAPTDQPLIASEPYTHGAMTVRVPVGWKKNAINSYVDIVEEASGRKVRLNVETTGATARKLLESAEGNLKKPNFCPAPYQRVDLHDTTLSGQPAAELEYTCGQGDQMRHGIWRAVVAGGKAYSFYLSTPESKFAESKVIYDELVRSFQLAA